MAWAFSILFRNAMVSGLMDIEHGDTLWPFVRQFYGQPSSDLWDDSGITSDAVALQSAQVSHFRADRLFASEKIFEVE